MKYRFHPLTLSEVQLHTEINAKMMERMRRTIDDPDFEKRLREYVQCPYCYYMENTVAGYMCTESQCGICGTRITSATTYIDRLCRACAKREGLCSHCGATLEGKPRRKPIEVSKEALDGIEAN